MSTFSTARAALVAACLVGAGLVGAAPVQADPPPPTREADLALAQVDRDAVRLLRLLDESRRARHLARIACVDRQLSQLNSFGRILLLHRERLVTATQHGDGATAARERAIIRRVTVDVRDITREGLACVYPPAGQADHTVVEVTISADTPVERDLAAPTRP
ncbi:MAG: hypothetical protein KC619_04225 [Myxococcales bacterium]|nr:hypothetical protein [Myxococcales bacterium]